MRKILLAVIVAAVAVVGGSWFYIKVISDPEERLTIDDSASSTTAPSAAADDGTTDGKWNVTEESIVGYRVKETLFGASNEATGRTSEVAGSITINGSSVDEGSFTVDMTTVTSDRTQRDGQFRGRIMNVSQFPTATFKLTSPITLSSVELDEEVNAKATGDLTLHGATKKVTFSVVAKRVTGQIRVNGTIPVRFADYDIDNPSGGPAQVGDDGTLEFTLVFSR
jgi:polyisoprenoid-binding protein YceI